MPNRGRKSTNRTEKMNKTKKKQPSNKTTHHPSLNNTSYRTTTPKTATRSPNPISIRPHQGHQHRKHPNPLGSRPIIPPNHLPDYPSRIRIQIDLFISCWLHVRPLLVYCRLYTVIFLLFQTNIQRINYVDHFAIRWVVYSLLHSWFLALLLEDCLER